MYPNLIIMGTIVPQPIRMDAVVRARWVARLRSGMDKQGENYLTWVNSIGQEKDCCMGVLCKEMGLKRKQEHVITPISFIYGDGDPSDSGDASNTVLPRAFRESMGITRLDPTIIVDDQVKTTLSGANDRLCLTFKEIASLIERQL